MEGTFNQEKSIDKEQGYAKKKRSDRPKLLDKTSEDIYRLHAF
jgi:hypothetical protein